jgi:hypothetical protein
MRSVLLQCHLVGRNSPFCIAIRYGLAVRGSNPAGGEIFLTFPDRPWGPPCLLYNGHRVFPGGKGAGAWRWPPTPFSAEVKESVELYLYSPFLAFVACSRANFTFTFTFYIVVSPVAKESIRAVIVCISRCYSGYGSCMERSFWNTAYNVGVVNGQECGRRWLWFNFICLIVSARVWR